VAPFTRHLLVANTVTDADIIELLSTFRNIENLAIWSGSIGPKILKMMKDLPLRMLSIDLRETNLDEAIECCPATFKNLTHLELLDLKGSTWNDYKALAEFPRLSHLGLDYSLGMAFLDLLEHCPSLQVLIYLVGKTRNIKSDDPRFLVLQDDIEWTVYWKSSANGRIGFWELADIIIEARRSEVHSIISLAVFHIRLFWDHS
jgi:hypothetical protein